MATLEEQVGAVVRHLRKRADLTQAELAERIDRQPGAVQNIENGNAGPTFETIKRLSKALEVDARDLFGVGDFAAKEGRIDPLVEIVEVLSTLSDDELEAMKLLIQAAVGLRRL